jgi:site-specific recombinase XerD
MFLSKRGRTYYLFYFDEIGKRHKISTRCVHKSDALKFLQEFKAREYEHRLRLQRTSLSQFIQDFLTHGRSNKTANTLEVQSVALRVFLRFVGDVPLHNVGVREIEAFLTWKRAEVSDYTVRFYYIALASAFETAKRWNCIATNPFRLVEKPKTRELQPPHFSKDEFRTLLQTVGERDLRELYLCAVFTGMRLGELAALQWTDVDFVRKVLHVRNSGSFTTKSKKNRIVPMNEQLWRVLAVRKEGASCELVFHKSGRQLTKDEVSKTFKRYVYKAGVNVQLHFHSLRHTFATWLVQEGVSLYEVQKLLGHSNISTTQVYSHLQPEHLHDTVNKITVTLN